ncbi:MAG: hypothetical protein VKL39_20180, partial [Leptolyngbyaceae bacterium]|nr:hypothetical protein [Leptolyngbyaceae bacterium]
MAGLTLSACPILPTSSSGITPTSDAHPSDTPSNPWANRVGELDLAPWQVEPCEGTAPFLCVYNQQNLVGTVEFQSWPLDNRTDLQTYLSEAGLNQGAIDLNDPAQQSQIVRALHGLVSEYYSSIEEDLSTGSDAVTFEAEPPGALTVGSLPGLRYGF